MLLSAADHDVGQFAEHVPNERNENSMKPAKNGLGISESLFVFSLQVISMRLSSKGIIREPTLVMTLCSGRLEDRYFRLFLWLRSFVD